MSCDQCGQPVPDGARFCPSCGAPQQGVSEGGPMEERRVVTVLFADLVGFTSLAEHRDPEQVKRLVDSAFALLVDDVERHGGVVDKLLGDGIVALFGAPVAHEDDADRAVRAGLAMQQTLAAFRDDHPADDLRMRIGINTGEVVVGTIAGTDYTAMGDVVNTAARLQQAAPVDAVHVGGATRSLCSSHLRFTEADAIRLRGRDGVTDVWRAIAVDQANPRRRWASDVPFVGRTAEMSILRAVIATVGSGRSAIVAVSGEAGIGKSRLVGEAIAELAADRPETLLLEGACASYGETNVWWPVAGSVLQQLGLDRLPQDEHLRDRIVAKLEPFEELDAGSPDFDRFVEFVLHLLGRPSALDALGPAAVRDAVVAGMVRGLRRRAERTPIVMWIDDVQWAAPALLDVLERVVRQMNGLPLVIATTMRSDGDIAERWPPAVEPALHLHLSLEPLPEPDALSLIAAAAAGQSLDARVVRAISNRSGGNPLFLIELARLAVAQGGSEGGDLPGTLRALIAARIDQLPTAQREILDNAAVIGNDGPISSLRIFAEELGQTYDPDALLALIDADLLVRDRRRWRFRSDVVREVAYQTLTKQVRAQRHAGVARHLAAHDPQLVDRRAHHMATAAEITLELGPVDGVPGDACAVAIDWLTEAALGWRRQGAAHRGVRVTERALRLADRTSPVGHSLRLLLIQLLVDQHAYGRARVEIAELRPEAEQSGDVVTLAEAARLLGTIEQMEGDLVAARRDLGRAVEALREVGDDARLAEALRARGFAEVFGGSLSEAERYLLEADALYAGPVDDPRGAAWVQQNLAWVSFLSGDHATSERRLHTAITEFEQLGDRSGGSWSKGLLGYVHHFNRRNDEALEMAEQALHDAKQWGDTFGASMMLNLQASVHLWRGDLVEANDLAERALAGFRKIDDRFGQIQALGVLNRTSVALGRTSDVDRTVEEILVLSSSFGELAYPDIAAAGTAMHRGRGREAVERGRSAVGRLDTTGANVDEGRVVIAFGEILVGEPEMAITALFDVNVERSPFALAARATASAMLGDHARARADADAVMAMDEVSYWDRCIALAAAYGASSGRERETRGARLFAAVSGVADRVVIGYVECLADRVAVTAAGDGPTDAATAVADGGSSWPVDLGGWADVAARINEMAPR